MADAFAKVVEFLNANWKEFVEIVDKNLIPVLLCEKSTVIRRGTSMPHMIMTVYSDVESIEILRERIISQYVLHHPVRYEKNGTDLTIRNPFVTVQFNIFPCRSDSETCTRHLTHTLTISLWSPGLTSIDPSNFNVSPSTII